MSKRLYLPVALIVAAVLLSACGGGGAGKPPVAMQKYETSTFTMEYPSAWQNSSMDLMGLSMVLFSTQELKPEDLGGLDFESLARTEPVVVVMYVPASLASSMGMADIESAMSEAQGEIASEPDVKILKQGDTTIGGAKGKILAATGTDPDIGKMGAHIVMAKRDDGTVVVLMGATPDKNLDTNMKIFEYMQTVFKFK